MPSDAENAEATVVEGVAVKAGAKEVGGGPEDTLRYPAPPEADAGVAGNWSSTCEETVKPPVPAVVVQINSAAVVMAFAPVPDVVPE